jgi:hypothetical protein
MRSPETKKNECIIAAFRVTEAKSNDYVIAMLNNVVPPEVCKIGFSIFPAGFVIDGFFLETSDETPEDYNEEYDEETSSSIFYTDLKVVH